MAAFFLLLAILGGVLVGDLVWENTASEVTVLDRSVSGYSLGWLLAAAAGLGLVIGLLLVASASSTKGRRERRRRVRSMQHNPEYEGIKPWREPASWLGESSPT